jgi:hypothetical protein
MSFVKTSIYPNSLILERDALAFLRKEGRMKNLPIGVAGQFIMEAADLIL